MSFVNPPLWLKSSNITFELCYANLLKHKHLLKWKNNESILEFGFASGNNSEKLLVPLLPKDYKEFVGTDISKEMVECAKSSFTLPRSKITQLDIASNIPKEFQHRFDRIFSFFAFHLVRNPRKAFQNIYDMLKPGGMTFLIFFEQTPTNDIFDRLRKHPKWGKYGQEEMISPYFDSNNPQEEYKKDLEVAKFKKNVLDVEKGSYRFRTEKDIDDLLTAVNVTIPKIPKEEREEYMKKYLDEKNRCQNVEIINQNGRKNYTMHASTLIVVATKPE